MPSLSVVDGDAVVSAALYCCGGVVVFLVVAVALDDVT